MFVESDYNSFERDPITPQWSFSPQEHEHAPEGRPPFDVLYVPERPEVIDPRNVFFNHEGRARNTDALDLENQIVEGITRQRAKTEVFNNELREKLRRDGMSEEEIPHHLRKFFDGKLARLHPADITSDGENLMLRLGQTTYFTYAGSRERKNLAYGYDRLGLALAVCTVVKAPSESGRDQLVYTIRGTANESYPGWYHAVGGTVQTLEQGIANPHRAIERELIEELGIYEGEFVVDGIGGVVMNNFDLHPEILYHTSIDVPLESWFGIRETDKEVNAATFTDTPENLKAFLLGQPIDEIPDPRPIVPSGLAAFLLHGRIKYGQEWYEQVLKKIPQY